MMATTHALLGASLAAPLAVLAPEYAPVAFAAGVLGGVVPDLDLYAAHRKTLHYPVYYSAAALPAVLVALAIPRGATIAAAFFFLSAALHSVADAFGGGLELRPWRGESERAVYDHCRETWISPRRWVRYDGSPEDLLLAAGLAVPALLVYGEPIRTVVLGLLVVSGGYALVRKPLVEVTERLVRRLPDGLACRLPDRFIEDFQ